MTVTKNEIEHHTRNLYAAAGALERFAGNAVIYLCQGLNSGEIKLDPPEDGDWLRSALEECAKLEPDKERAGKIKDALWEPVMYRNHYHCEECKKSWSDEWSCMCDDDCPKCGGAYSPQSSEKISP